MGTTNGTDLNVGKLVAANNDLGFRLLSQLLSKRLARMCFYLRLL